MTAEDHAASTPEQSGRQMRTADSPPAVPPPRHEGKIELLDGRSLGYAEYGPPDGSPLVFCHGTPGSRYTRHPDESHLKDHGIRQITLERPGYGKSSFQPNRALLDWPDDVREATDVLGLDEFTVAGISGGGPHALACAARLPDRVSAVAVLNGMGPYDAPGATDGMALQNRLSFKLAKLPLILRVTHWLGVRQIRKDPDAVLDSIGDSFADVDGQLLQRPEVRAMLRQDLREAVQQGSKGWVRDTRVLAGEWGFDLSDITIPVDLWHGELDANTPKEMARYMADELPSCEAHIYSDEGHLLIINHWDEMLSALEARLDARG